MIRYTRKHFSAGTIRHTKYLQLPQFISLHPLHTSFQRDASIRDMVVPSTHFRMKHFFQLPLPKKGDEKRRIAESFERLQKGIYTPEELKVKTTNIYKHKPATLSDHIMHGLMSAMYHSFNFLTGYKKVNPTVRSIERRLIVLESVAGVPGKPLVLS